MFSKHTYLLHQELPPNSGASTSMVNDILLQDMLSGHYPVSTDPAPVLFNHELLGQGPNGDPSSMAHMCQKSGKKDRHSKIHTAQGPRDRRVRLSIGVARKFFDLQEMLGFDKPSKTLDWLLTKSKSAIKHLVHTKHPSGSVIIQEIHDHNNHYYNNNNNNDDDGFVVDDDDNDDYNNNNNNNRLLKKKGKSAAAAANKKKSKGGPHSEAALNLARESRVKARARARERTREKMCIKQQIINEYDQMGPVPIQYMNNQLEVCRISASAAGINMHYDPVNDDLIQESNVIKRKQLQVNKHHHHHHNNNNNPSIFGFHPAVHLGYNNNNNINGTDNWDITNFSSQSSLSAILDQHKFDIHSSSNN